MDLVCVACGHGWCYHHEYDEDLERYTPQPCDHWSGCGCEAFITPSEEDQ